MGPGVDGQGHGGAGVTKVSCAVWNDPGGRYLVGPCGCACVEITSEWPFGPSKPACQRFVWMRREWDESRGQAPVVVGCADSIEESVALSLMEEA